jgi:hypothetical protein
VSAVSEDRAPLFFRDLAMLLFDNGYQVVPIAPKGFKYRRGGNIAEAPGKGPIEPGWQGFADSQTAADVERLIANRPGWGVGILHKRAPGIDIDVSLDAAAREIHALAEQMFGGLLVRFGRAPRRMLVGRCDAPFRRVKTADFTMPGDKPGDKPHSVEVRCDGKQFVAFGMHPDTEQPYFWEGHTPLEVRREELPPIDAERAAQFINEATGILASHGGVRVKTLRERGDAAPRSAGELRARDAARAREWIRAIPNDNLSRDDWVYMAHAIKGALGEDGFDDFLEFSKKSEKHHSEATVRKLWDPIEAREIGAGTLFHLAIEAGWREDPIEDLNASFAVVRVANKAAILNEHPDDKGLPTFSLLSPASFKLLLANRSTEITVTNRKGEAKKRVAVADVWIRHPRRRQHEGVVFAPRGAPPGYYNMWRGFAVEPSETGSCELFKEHLRNNVCAGDGARYSWVFGWFADIVQHPAEKCGTSLVLRGAMGVGKTIVGETFGRLLGLHYVQVSDPRYVTGRFNAHLVRCLLLHCDEAFWAGDKDAEGKLKDLVTGRRHPIELKGYEAFFVDNYVRLFVNGNPEWLVPAGMDERRFATLDVGEKHKRDIPYFRAIVRELEGGGYGRLMHELMTFDLSGVDLRTIPKTEALLDQKFETLSAFEKWWLTTLREGRLPGGCDEDNACPVKAFYQRYLDHSAMIHHRSPRSIETQFGMSLRKMMPLTKGGRPDMRRYPGTYSWYRDGPQVAGYVYQLPALTKCRRRFEELIEQEIEWEYEGECHPIGDGFEIEAEGVANWDKYGLPYAPNSGAEGGTATTSGPSATSGAQVADEIPF